VSADKDTTNQQSTSQLSRKEEDKLVSLQEKLSIARQQVEMVMQAVNASGMLLKKTYGKIEKTNTLLTQNSRH
jgi:hypothetical protein